MEFVPQSGIWDLVRQATIVVQLVMLLLVGMSLASWSIIFYKIIILRRAKQQALADFKRFQNAPDLGSAVHILARSADSPLYPLAYQAVAELKRLEGSALPAAQRSRIAMDNLRRVLRQNVSNSLRNMASSLSFLATCASSAPFIGLFGTVWGIMHSFHAIGLMGSASLATVAPGLSEALVATAIGLAVAIPASVAYNFFRGQLGSIEVELINFAGAFLNRVQRELPWISGQVEVEENGLTDPDI
ncbi:Cell division and transport-associated protein TolQ [Desulfonatronum thiosulfatophilum]|uniref:Cell division and transport-associated protein TolQ n=1 Tax=Desulfonatronum thiosulfatophilum TaxID=617002 RepID=A0A1G6DQ49_9BACT|nr:MotA/TolQ/ExbB proton channel family protein [Desulfonatronum thiosulfatophilum]SDB47313.1 Cell division and transport-associated protein TolQ [Desulfonatronum thiosulfatophilum]